MNFTMKNNDQEIKRRLILSERIVLGVFAIVALSGLIDPSLWFFGVVYAFPFAALIAGGIAISIRRKNPQYKKRLRNIFIAIGVLGAAAAGMLILFSLTFRLSMV